KAKDAQLASKDEQMRVKDVQIAEKDKQLDQQQQLTAKAMADKETIFFHKKYLSRMVIINRSGRI
ncbi:DUF536 domain-containing protein, partial [Streptococcus dysgalactiae]|uniref:DUF536 domain-containing protein n=1 Tax=Streptococcus dysgalactiae TaxID=1334 RepID=UPI000AE63614